MGIKFEEFIIDCVYTGEKCTRDDFQLFYTEVTFLLT